MSTTTTNPLRQRMIEDMTARKFGLASQRSHIESCERFAAYLKRSPATATPDDVRLFQLDLIESGLSIPNRNRIMSGAKFLVPGETPRRPDLVLRSFSHEGAGEGSADPQSGRDGSVCWRWPAVCETDCC